ncbi:MAG: HEAT repeat domain-containing protein [Gemmataceae bacterium]
MADLQSLIAHLEARDASDRQHAAVTLASMGEKAREAVPYLLHAVADVEPGVRLAATEALDQIDPNWPHNPLASEAVPGLATRLGSRFPEVQKAAMAFLCKIGQPAVPELISAFTNVSQDGHRVIIAWTFRELGQAAAEAVPTLTEALESESASVRQAAAEALAEMGPASQSAVAALVVLLADWHPKVRECAALSLAGVGPSAEVAIPPLIQLLTDKDELVREAAVKALGRIGPASVPALLEILRTRDFPAMQQWLEGHVEALDWFAKAAECLETGRQVRFSPAKDRRPEELDAVRREPLKAVRNIGWQFRHAVEERLLVETAHETAVRILGKVGAESPEAISLLVKIMVDGNQSLRLAAIRSLGEIGVPARNALPFLVESLVDRSKSVRRATAQSLPAIDPNWATNSEMGEAVRSFLEKLKQSGEPGVIAAEAFVLAGAASVPVLVRGLTEGDRVLREASATTLGRLGEAAKEAIPALTQAAKEDKHRWVREAADGALKKITPAG